MEAAGGGERRDAGQRLGGRQRWAGGALRVPAPPAARSPAWCPQLRPVHRITSQCHHQPCPKGSPHPVPVSPTVPHNCPHAPHPTATIIHVPMVSPHPTAPNHGVSPHPTSQCHHSCPQSVPTPHILRPHPHCPHTPCPSVTNSAPQVSQCPTLHCHHHHCPHGVPTPHIPLPPHLNPNLWCPHAPRPSVTNSAPQLSP